MNSVLVIYGAGMTLALTALALVVGRRSRPLGWCAFAAALAMLALSYNFWRDPVFRAASLPEDNTRLSAALCLRVKDCA